MEKRKRNQIEANLYHSDMKETKYELVSLKKALYLLEKSETRVLLITGPPGIGKSDTIKEISYQWACRRALKPYKFLFLLKLRDPEEQNLKTLSDLLNLQKFRGVTTTDTLQKTGGKNVAILLDGYDELPESLQKSGFIADILKRQVLPGCAIIVSSRPHAVPNLSNNAIHVEILGFSKESQTLFIDKSLTEEAERKELKAYLRENRSINSLLLVPFSMTMLLFIFKEQREALPKNSTKFYNLFITLIIRANLAKFGIHLDRITDFHHFPSRYTEIIKALSKLALKGLNKRKLVFTFEEIQTECPQIVNCSDAINGYGLLQATTHDGIQGEIQSFNFLHLSVQEYLAAEYVAKINPYEQFVIISEKFWRGSFSSMIKFYVNIVITKGQPQALKCFLSENNYFDNYAYRLITIMSTCIPFKMVYDWWFPFDDEIVIAQVIFENKLKCMHLYQCFKEADDDRMCQSIDETVFSNGEIDFSNTKLSLTDMECIATFLIHSSIREWTKLDFTYSYFQDDGLDILHSALQGGNIRIRELVLAYDGLTIASSKYISDIVITCEVDDLSVGGDDKHVGETEDFYSTIIAGPNSRLEKLSLGRNKITSKSAIKIFQLIIEGKSKLEMLFINNNEIDDEAVDTITAALRVNSTLQVLKMEQNKITGEEAERIVRALEHNDTLQTLVLSTYSKEIEQKITVLQEMVNEKRKGRGCQIELEIKFLDY